MQKKIKKKVPPGSKRNQWVKGQSCVSNPGQSKHRLKAKSKLFNSQRPPISSFASLTLDSVKVHDGCQNNSRKSMDFMMDDDEGTVGTNLSGLSDCTNMSFSKIQKFWRKGSLKHKQVCAILAAITEVIRQQGAAESDTAYFAALVTALETVDDVESVYAIVYLLSMICKRVPDGVLRAKFSSVSSLLVKYMSKFGKESPAMLRSTLICLCALLRSLGPEEWSNSSTANVYQNVLSNCFFSKPKVRKVVHHGVCSVLKSTAFLGNNTSADFHPASVPTAKYCIQVIEKSGAITDSNCSVTCHAVSLLGETLHCFPTNWLKTSCETILKLMVLSQPVLKLVSFQALYAMFKNHPAEAKLGIDLCGKILTSLYDYQPSVADSQLLQPWLGLMSEGVKHLVHVFSSSERKVDMQNLVLAHIHAVLKACFKIMEACPRSCAVVAASTISIAIDRLSACKEFATPEMYSGAVNKAFGCLSDGLQFKFHAVRDLTLESLQVGFSRLSSSENSDAVCVLVGSMVNLRDTLSPHDKSIHDKALSAAVESLGPKAILEVVPLMIGDTGSAEDFERSWMLPLLKNCVKNTEIEFFTSYFLPLAASIRIKALQSRKAGSDATASVYDALQYQIWSLLPNFCDGATDIATAFPVLARTLGSAITERADIRPLAMQALRSLVSSCKDADDKNVLKRFAKNYLPILFNLYTTPPAGFDPIKNGDWSKSKSPERLAALETIRVYLEVTDRPLVQNFFSKSLTRVFNSPTETDSTRLSLLDLVVCMVPHVDLESLTSVYQDVKPMLRSPNQRIQKKAYRLLNTVLGSSSPDCRKFVDGRLDEISGILTASLTAASPSSKGSRLTCIKNMLVLLGSDEKHSSEKFVTFLRDSIPEVILCTRDKRKVRAAAFSILVTAGNTYCDAALRVAERDEEEIKKRALQEYFEICSVGLGGSDTAITATICGLSRIIYEFNEAISSDLLNDCICKVCLLLGTNTRQVCKAALGFVTVLLSILSKAALAQHLEEIIGSLFQWSSETRRHFRFKVKKLLERLVRKFGYDMIHSMVPDDHKKQMANFRKTRDRQKRQQRERRLGQRGGDDSGSDEEDNVKDSNDIDELLTDSDSDDGGRPAEKKRKRMSYRIEESRDEPLDLLDKRSSRNVVATLDRRAQKRRRTDQPFAKSEDGRMIIEDFDKATTAGDSSKNLSSFEKLSRGGAEMDDDVETVKGSVDKSYAHGGIGIHRKINDDKVVKKEKRSAKTKQAHEPYAYIPLKKAVLNKRKQKKLRGEFEGMVRAAKSGRKKGQKSKGKRAGKA